MSKTIYIAGPLFTQGERTWNSEVATLLRKSGYQVVLPQEGIDPDVALTDVTLRRLFQAALAGVRESDAVVAILDGPDPDSGTCFECGIAYASGKPIIGIRTDLRFGGDDPSRGVNLMLSQSCGRFHWLGIDAVTASVPAVLDHVLSSLREVGVLP